MKGLLLAGGHGTRLRPLTYTGNKHMLPVANKPILFYGLEDLENAGITDIGIILGPLKEGVKEAVGDGSKFRVRITYIDQPEPKGIAHAVGIAQDFIGDDPFVVYLGDNLLKKGIREFVKEFQNEEWDELLLLSKIEDLAVRKRFGVADIEKGKVLRVIEKPEKPEELASDLVMVGIYMFRSKIFDAIKKLTPSWRGELEITDTIQKLIDWDCSVVPRLCRGWWKDTGKPEDLLEANQLILSDLKSEVRGIVEEKETIRGSVSIGEETIIRRGSSIRGPAIIGRNCDIGPNVYIGPYTSVGDNCVIRKGDIEQSILIGDAIIDCERRIVDSIIGRYTKIVSSDHNLPKGTKLLLGDSSFVTL